MFIDKNLNRINPYSIICVDGITYPGNILQFPDAVESLGIVEVSEPRPPEDYTDDSYFKTELISPPYIYYEKKSDLILKTQKLNKKKEDISNRTLLYKSNVLSLQLNWLSTLISDGELEEEKKATIQLDLDTLKNEYMADINAIKNKYL